MGISPQLSPLPGWIPRLTVALALAMTLLLGAGQAQASAASQCIGELASWVPPAPSPPKQTQERSEADAYWDLWMSDGAAPCNTVSPREVPMCLSEGASAIAPRTVQPTDDSRIEVTPRCNPFDGPDQFAPSPDERPDHRAPLLGDAMLPAPPSPVPGVPAPLVLPRCMAHGDAPGFRHIVYRPPRG